MERRPSREALRIPSSARSRWRLDAAWASAAFAARTTAAAQLSLLAAWSLGLKHTAVFLDGSAPSASLADDAARHLRDAARILRREHALFER